MKRHSEDKDPPCYQHSGSLFPVHLFVPDRANPWSWEMFSWCRAVSCACATEHCARCLQCCCHSPDKIGELITLSSSEEKPPCCSLLSALPQKAEESNYTTPNPSPCERLLKNEAKKYPEQKGSSRKTVCCWRVSVVFSLQCCNRKIFLFLA